MDGLNTLTVQKDEALVMGTRPWVPWGVGRCDEVGKTSQSNWNVKAQLLNNAQSAEYGMYHSTIDLCHWRTVINVCQLFFEIIRESGLVCEVKEVM